MANLIRAAAIGSLFGSMLVLVLILLAVLGVP